MHVTDYVCGARLCFSGAGADELLLGYGRHRSVYSRMAKDGLSHDDAMGATSIVGLRDMNRWPRRNGARDDRCVADHARELRLPFLDSEVEHVVLSNGGPGVFADLSEPQGCGDKRALRDIAASLGLRESAQLVKRALQFGTRAAKASNSYFFGSNAAANKRNCGGKKMNWKP